MKEGRERKREKENEQKKEIGHEVCLLFSVPWSFGYNTPYFTHTGLIAPVYPVPFRRDSMKI